MYDEIVVPAGLDPLAIYFECGRPITGPYGWLVSTAIHEKHIYREYIALDSCMADLMRPGMYGSYHEITVSGKENAPKDHVYDVVGSLCENCDKFAVQRELPKIDMGDLVLTDALWVTITTVSSAQENTFCVKTVLLWKSAAAKLSKTFLQHLT